MALTSAVWGSAYQIHKGLNDIPDAVTMELFSEHSCIVQLVNVGVKIPICAVELIAGLVLVVATPIFVALDLMAWFSGKRISPASIPFSLSIIKPSNIDAALFNPDEEKPKANAQENERSAKSEDIIFQFDDPRMKTFQIDAEDLDEDNLRLCELKDNNTLLLFPDAAQKLCLEVDHGLLSSFFEKIFDKGIDSEILFLVLQSLKGMEGDQIELLLRKLMQEKTPVILAILRCLCSPQRISLLQAFSKDCPISDNAQALHIMSTQAWLEQSAKVPEENKTEAGKFLTKKKNLLPSSPFANKQKQMREELLQTLPSEKREQVEQWEKEVSSIDPKIQAEFTNLSMTLLQLAIEEKDDEIEKLLDAFKQNYPQESARLLAPYFEGVNYGS